MNPFVITGKIPEKYFCDRISETKELVNYLTNNNNVVLISPRRMGKSALIEHCYGQKEINKEYATLYLDILQSSSLKEFVYLFGKAIYESIVPKTTKWILKFFQTFSSLNGKISVDPVSGYPSFGVMLGEINNPVLTLEEIFRFINNYNKRVIIAIDEFQQITKYPEKNIEAILRSHIQQSDNVNFIFSGSERHLMAEIFLSHSRPFYHSASVLSLEAIPSDIYVEFAKKQFEQNGKKVDVKDLYKLYDLFNGVTFYMQKTLNEAFYNLAENKICDTGFLNETIFKILESNSLVYREILSNLPEKQKDLLYALALEGETEAITSADFIKKYSLLSSSSVQSASKVLLEKEFITKTEKKYSVYDKFFALWIKKIYGPGSLTLLKD